MCDVHRMRSTDPNTNPVEGKPVWSPIKSIWFSSMLVAAIVGGTVYFSWDAVLMSALLTATTLCLGHSVGFHRLLIHRSFECPRWLEYVLVYLGTLVGMGGPRRMAYLHDIRDWSQRQSKCHAFFIHKTPIWIDWIWQMHCELRLSHPPVFQPDAPITKPRIYRLLDATWMAQQIPLALVLFIAGGLPWLFWGICVRIVVSHTGHWLVGYVAHNWGKQTWTVDNAAIQGYNLPGLGLITMGEAWHNNHHAYPKSARLGLSKWQLDPGWWFVATLRRVGLAWKVRLPENLPPREELRRVRSRQPMEIVSDSNQRREGAKLLHGRFPASTGSTNS